MSPWSRAKNIAYKDFQGRRVSVVRTFGTTRGVAQRSAGLAAQTLHLVRGRSTGGVTSKPALASFHELLGPGVIQALGNAFRAAQLGDGVITAQAVEHDPDFVFRGKMPTGLAADVLHHLLGRRFRP